MTARSQAHRLLSLVLTASMLVSAVAASPLAAGCCERDSESTCACCVSLLTTDGCGMASTASRAKSEDAACCSQSKPQPVEPRFQCRCEREPAPLPWNGSPTMTVQLEKLVSMQLALSTLLPPVSDDARSLPTGGILQPIAFGTQSRSLLCVWRL